MVLAVLAALCMGICATSITLWVTGYGAMTPATVDRLNRIRGFDEQLQADTPRPSLNLRKRASVSLGGINLVSSNIVAKWTQDLSRAGLTLNAREYFTLRVIVGLVLAMLGMVFIPVPLLALLGLPLGYFLVGFWLRHRVASRRQKLEGQLVELLQMLSSGLRAGFGLLQAMEAASDQLPDPIATEIRRTMRDTAMGASVENALAALNERVGSPDFDIVITAILIQRNVGGNLAEILDNVAHTMRERERIKGEIRTLTSQQRLTGYVIGGIPIGLLVIFYIISPDFVSLLFTEPLGRLMLIGAAVNEVLGFLVIRRIVNIEV